MRVLAESVAYSSPTGVDRLQRNQLDVDEGAFPER